ncbi:hypothetical protein HU200_059463 [Digitaria exilis]|uniref:Uncharacterized protein n=1 Tax=Digitaria exilis TaxID=1010633 RepID=A0A835ABD7_9POAL|nr:hypothetical protein HU200_059463 [Digitaria exilis]
MNFKQNEIIKDQELGALQASAPGFRQFKKLVGGDAQEPIPMLRPLLAHPDEQARPPQFVAGFPHRSSPASSGEGPS